MRDYESTWNTERLEDHETCEYSVMITDLVHQNEFCTLLEGPERFRDVQIQALVSTCAVAMLDC